MRHQIQHRSSLKSPVIVDEDCGIPTTVVDSYREHYEAGPLGPSDPQALLLSMSEYNKPPSYDVYDYNSATRSEQGQDYAGFASHPPYASEYVGAQAQVPSGLPQSTGLNLMPSAHQGYGTHDPTYYSQQHSQYPAYLASEVRQLPELVSFSPDQGQQGTKVTVYFRSDYDLNNPQVSVVMMFGQERCDSVLSKTSHQGPPYSYALSAQAPSLSATNTPSPTMSLSLMFEGPSSTTWQSPKMDFGQFTYLDQYPIDSPTQVSRKRKLTPEITERQSPPKKQSYAQLPPSTQSYYHSAPSSATAPASYGYDAARRFSVPENTYGQTLPRVQTQQYYGAQPASATSRMQSAPSPYSYYANLNTTRSPSTAGVSAGARASQLLPSPAGGSNPPLIRTSTIQQSPTTPGTTQSFNPYTMYPANTKAMLKIEGDLNSMVDGWTPEEWEVKRRLVQFRRSQAGSVISTSFEAVTPESRTPNSICVSCIWWAEKNECYVTSVDTIQLLEALVAVRFTVEEKNRIRRNLEGFRPATVSKTKPDSEEFFKLIMGFPNPKPRNIEKDVKVFPWRILSTALKKIIGKYSASYSSTAGALHQPVAGASSYGRGSTAGLDPSQQMQRPIASPMSTSSSIPHAYATTMTTQGYAGGSAGLGIGPSAGPPDLRLTVPGAGAGHQHTASWHQPGASHYSSSATDLSGSGSGARGASWDFGSYMGASPATGLPGSAQAAQYQYGMSTASGQQRVPSLQQHHSSQAMNEGRFLPLYEQDNGSQQTSGV